MAILTDFQKVNSTSYVDVVGLEQGIDRLPGETTITYLRRLYHAAVARRDHSIEGLINELSIRLGLSTDAAIEVTSTNPLATLECSAAGVKITSNTVVHKVQVVETANDNVWEWRLLSDVVAGINAIPGFTATLLVPDASAVQVARQSNIRFDGSINPPVVSYVWPYDIVRSEVAVIGLTDPDFQDIAADANSAIAYQVREAIQTLMLEDRSYWAK